MQGALAGKPIEAFQNVVPLEKVALTKSVVVDTPDSAPTEGGESPVIHEAAPPGTPASPEKTLPGEAPSKINSPAQTPAAPPVPRS